MGLNISSYEEFTPVYFRDRAILSRVSLERILKNGPSYAGVSHKIEARPNVKEIIDFPDGAMDISIWGSTDRDQALKILKAFSDRGVVASNDAIRYVLAKISEKVVLVKADEKESSELNEQDEPDSKDDFNPYDTDEIAAFVDTQINHEMGQSQGKLEG